jgi:hypothetical protein
VPIRKLDLVSFLLGISAAENQEDHARGEEVSRCLIIILQEHLKRKWIIFQVASLPKYSLQFSPHIPTKHPSHLKSINSYFCKKEIKKLPPPWSFQRKGRKLL